MNYLKTVSALTAFLIAGPANAWDHYSRHNSNYHYNYSNHHHRHGNDEAAVALVGGLLIGAALAQSSTSRTTYSSATPYYSDYPSRYSADSTTYVEPYYRERVYVAEPIVHTTYYSQPTYYNPPAPRTYSSPQYHYPKRKPVARVVYGETLRDEHGNCFRIEHRDGRKALNKVPRYQCSED